MTEPLTIFNVGRNEIQYGWVWKFETDLGDYYYFRGVVTKEDHRGNNQLVIDSEIITQLHNAMDEALNDY